MGIRGEIKLSVKESREGMITARGEDANMLLQALLKEHGKECKGNKNEIDSKEAD